MKATMKVTKDLKSLISIASTLFTMIFFSEIVINELSFIGLLCAINKLSTILFVILIVFIIVMITLHTFIEVINEKDNHGNV